MAAALLGSLAPDLSGLRENPWDFIAGLLTELGAILLLVGVALGFVGFYLKAYSVKAKGDAASGIATVESVFGNVGFNAPQQPYLSITTPNVANDISNLGNDAWRFLSNTANQAWADLKGIATAIDDIPKALVQLVSQGPGIAINGFLGLVAEALGDIFILVFPYAILFGSAMLAAGVGMKVLRYVYDAYLRPELSQWLDRTVGDPLGGWAHRLLGNPDPVGPAPPIPMPPPGPVMAAAPEPTSPEASEPVPVAEIPSPSIPVVGQMDPPLPEPAPETLVAVPTPEVEEALGASYQGAKDRWKALRRKRDAPSESAEEDYVGWAYSRIGASA